MQNNIMYFRKGNKIEYICYQSSTKSYPMHTHACHVTIGYVLEGEVCLTSDGQKYIYRAGEYFCILPDIPHALDPVNDTPYSMVSVCIPDDGMLQEWKNEIGYIKRLKKMILDEPDNTLFLKDIAQNLGVSPYHMIRQFKDTCGLTPHQFRIQCRVRKAQRLLEEGASAIEVAYAVGFYDQSHFDRCFRKVVGLTPQEYKKSARLLA